MLPTPDYKIYSLHLDIRQYQHNPYLVVFAPENLPESPAKRSPVKKKKRK
jgi:hypothetical protein